MQRALLLLGDLEWPTLYRGWWKLWISFTTTIRLICTQKYGMVKRRTWGWNQICHQVSATLAPFTRPLCPTLPPRTKDESTSSSRSFERDFRDGEEWSREDWRRKRKRTTKIHSSNEEILCSKKITKNLTGKRITVHCVLNSNPQHIAHLHKQKKQKNVALIHGTDANPIGISPCTSPASPAQPRRRLRRRPWEYSSPSRT